jgi:endonuclease G
MAQQARLPKAPTDKAVAKAIQRMDGLRREWLGRPGVTAVDVGYRIKNGRLTDELALRAHVERKLPVQAVPKQERFNVKGKPPKTIGGVPVDVIEATYVPSQQPADVVVELDDVDRTARSATLAGGISVGGRRTGYGTLGAIVWDRRDCSVNILSNWHILANDLAATPGEPIYQPGVSDGGTRLDVVAQLNRSRLNQDMDAALARLNGSRPFTRDIVGLSPVAGIVAPRVGMRVIMSGRTSGVTEGIIDALGFEPKLVYDNNVRNNFYGQIHIHPLPPWPNTDYEFSQPGDSGAVVLDAATNRAVGLHFCTEINSAPQREFAGANPMVKVAAATGLNFSFSPLVCRDWASAICARWPWLCDPSLEALVSRPAAGPLPLLGLETVADARVQRDPPESAADREQLRATLREIQVALDALVRRLG